MSLAFFTLGLFCAPSAQAQGGYPGGGSGGPGSYPGYVGWVAQPVVIDGHKNTTHTDAQGHTTTSPVAFSNHSGFASPGTFTVGPGESATYTLSGTVTYTWKWQGGSNNVPPPTATLYVLKQGTASAYGSGDGQGTVTATASDGMGDDKPNRSVAPDGTSQSVSDDSSGNHLVPMDGSSGTLTVVGNLNVSMSLSEPVSGTYPGNGGGGTLSGSAGCNFIATLDSRSVVLYSFPTSHKDPGTGKAVPDIPDPDGTFEMTSIYSHHYWRDGGDPPSTLDTPFINWITFTSNFQGDWHWKSWTNHNGDPCSAPDVVDPDTWSWSPSESEDGWDYGKVSMGYGQIEYVDGVAQGQPTGNQTYHVSYTATDNTDKASATANAKIALHDEWENKQNANPATTGHSKRTYFYADGAKTAVRNDTKTKFTTAPTWTLTVNGSVTLGFTFSPSFDVGWAKVLGIEVNAAVTVGGSFGVSVPGPLLDPGYWTFPIVTTTWNTNNYLVDHYTVTGFEAAYPESADDPNSVVEGGSWTDPLPIGQLPPQ